MLSPVSLETNPLRGVIPPFFAQRPAATVAANPFQAAQPLTPNYVKAPLGFSPATAFDDSALSYGQRLSVMA